MSDHGTHHHEGEHTGEIKSKTAFISSFWFVLILVGLFIAALNFIDVMGNSEGHGGHEAAAGATHGDAHGAAPTDHHVADTTHTLGEVAGPAANPIDSANHDVALPHDTAAAPHEAAHH